MHEGWLGLGQIEAGKSREQLIYAALPMESLWLPSGGEIRFQTHVLHQVLGDARGQAGCVNAGGVQAEMTPGSKDSHVIPTRQFKNLGRSPALAYPSLRGSAIGLKHSFDVFYALIPGEDARAAEFHFTIGQRHGPERIVPFTFDLACHIGLYARPRDRKQTRIQSAAEIAPPGIPLQIQLKAAFQGEMTLGSLFTQRQCA